MPCDTQPNMTAARKEGMKDALKRLEQNLEIGGGVSLVIGLQGGIAFRGWLDQDRAGFSDLCAYRRLLASNSPALRKALARAEAVSGRKVDQRMLTAGLHSHDGGQTWGKH
jgi:hypothetical protein